MIARLVASISTLCALGSHNTLFVFINVKKQCKAARKQPTCGCKRVESFSICDTSQLIIATRSLKLEATLLHKPIRLILQDYKKQHEQDRWYKCQYAFGCEHTTQKLSMLTSSAKGTKERVAAWPQRNEYSPYLCLLGIELAISAYF